MILLVMGMGRSGTSLLMQVLQAAGFDCGNGWIADNDNNPRGYFELKPVMNCNIDILQKTSGDGDSLYPIPTREQIDQFNLSSIPIEFPQHDFAIKDPRFSLTLPVWESFLREQDCRIIFSRRDPEAIAESMARAYHMDLETSRNIIHEYIQRAEENIQRFNFPSVDVQYEDWFSNRESNIIKIEKLIERPLSINLEDVLDPTLFHCKGKKTGKENSDNLYQAETDIEKENFLTLETLHPQLLQNINETIQRNHCNLTKNSDGSNTALNPDTSKWIIPKEFIPSAFPSARYQNYEPTKQWLVVLGIDALCPISLLEKEHNALSPVLVIEPDITKVYTYFKFHSYVDIFRQPNVYWYIGEDCFDRVLSALDQEIEPYFVLPSNLYPVFRDITVNTYAEKVRRFMTVFQQKVKEKFSIIRKISELFQQKYQEPVVHKTALIVIPSIACWMVLGQGLAQGFRENGLEVLEYKVAFPPTKFSPYETLQSLLFIRKVCPDFIVTISHASDLFIRGIEDVPIKRIVWYADEPDHLIQKQHGQYDDIYFSWEDFADRLQNRNGNVKTEMLVGAFPLPHIQKPSLYCEVGFVGSIEDQSAFRFQCPNAILNEIDNIVDKKLDNIKTSISSLIQSSNLSENEKEHIYHLLDPTGQKLGMSPEQTMILSLHQECIRKRRLSLLCALDEFDLRIYGNASWENLLRGTPIDGAYQGHGLMYEECCNFYASCNISLNIHPPYLHSGINQRDLDIPMCDGFLLTDLHLHAQDRMEEFFIPDQEVALFSDQSELQDKVKYYLDHPKERRTITESAKIRIRKNHLFSKRVQTILKNL